MSKKEKKILILGILPPPIGGVSIHVSRLLDILERKSIPYKFCSLYSGICNILKELITAKIIHFHVSHGLLGGIVAICTFLTRKKVILTYHGNVFRMHGITRQIFCIGLRFADLVIVLNTGSLDFVKRYTHKVEMLSAFFPPQKEEPLPEDILQKVKNARNKYDRLFTTNAWSVRFNNENKEIYGISDLVELFRNRPKECLIISDPSGEYMQFFQSKNITLPANVVMITYPHSFFSLTAICDAMIRNTTTDGDSLSIKESLFLQKDVYATDVVSRCKGVCIFKNIAELKFLLETDIHSPTINREDLSDEIRLLEIYNHFLQC